MTIKISEKASVECSEEYRLKFWYTSSNGFRKQDYVRIFSNSRSAHKEVERYFNQHLKSKFPQCNPVSVTYQ